MINVLFWVVQNFRPFSRPLNSGLEKNALHIWIQNDLSFSKLFKIWKSDKKWQLNNPNNYFLYNTFPIVNTNPLLLFNVKLTLARWGPGNHFNGLIIGWPSGIVYIWANIPLGMYFQRVVVLLCVIYKQQKIGYHRYIIE